MHKHISILALAALSSTASAYITWTGGFREAWTKAHGAGDTLPDADDEKLWHAEHFYPPSELALTSDALAVAVGRATAYFASTNAGDVISGKGVVTGMGHTGGFHSMGSGRSHSIYDFEAYVDAPQWVRIIGSVRTYDYKPGTEAWKVDTSAFVKISSSSTTYFSVATSDPKGQVITFDQVILLPAATYHFTMSAAADVFSDTVEAHGTAQYDACIKFIPAPSTAPLAGLAALAAWRRRRPTA